MRSFISARFQMRHDTTVHNWCWLILAAVFESDCHTLHHQHFRTTVISRAVFSYGFLQFASLSHHGFIPVPVCFRTVATITTSSCRCDSVFVLFSRVNCSDGPEFSSHQLLHVAMRFYCVRTICVPPTLKSGSVHAQALCLKQCVGVYMLHVCTPMFRESEGFGFIDCSDRSVAPNGKVFVFWKNIESDDRFPFLVEGLDVEFSVLKVRDMRFRDIWTLRANNVTLVGGTRISLQDDIDAQTKRFVGGQHLRYTGRLKFFNPRRGFGYVEIHDGEKGGCPSCVELVVSCAETQNTVHARPVGQ